MMFFPPLPPVRPPTLAVLSQFCAFGIGIGIGIGDVVVSPAAPAPFPFFRRFRHRVTLLLGRLFGYHSCLAWKTFPSTSFFVKLSHSSFDSKLSHFRSSALISGGNLPRRP
jgi:hypothetical protein